MYQVAIQKHYLKKLNKLKNKIALVGFGYWGKVYYKYLKKYKIIVYTRSKVKNITNTIANLQIKF